MLEKISVQSLRPGMYLQAFCGSWLDHPFWRNGFVLTDPKDLSLILASGIREVWIDAARGLDVAAGVASAEAETVDNYSTGAIAPPPAVPEKTSFSQEAKRAARICAKSRGAVIAMFQEARMGKAHRSRAGASAGRGNFRIGHAQPRRPDQPGAAENR